MYIPKYRMSDLCKCGHGWGEHAHAGGDCLTRDVQCKCLKFEAAQHRMHLTAFGVWLRGFVSYCLIWLGKRVAEIGGR